MTVLDAQAVIALLRDEPAARAVSELISSSAVLSAVNAAEVMDVLIRAKGRNQDAVARSLAKLERAGVRLVPVSAELGVLAGELRARHYHRVRSSLSMVDCVAAATTLTEKVPLATSDPALAAVVRAEGGEVHPLPDQHGNTP